jgi:butyrate kinase
MQGVNSLDKKILVINPGSTSTKIAVFQEEECLFELKTSHAPKDLKPYKRMIDQYEFRMQWMIQALEEKGFDINTLDAVCGRGGMLQPLESGTYFVNTKMLDDLKNARRGEHASNLGAVMAHALSEKLHIPAFIVDPVAVDEMEDIARISGMKLIERDSLFHALNQKAIARQLANDLNRKYEELNLIVVHLGGGISVGVHKKGRVVDVNNALDGDGPMSPERSGTVPLGPLYKMVFSGKYTLDEIKKMNYGQGGLVSYLGTNDAREVCKRIDEGDSYAKLIFDAMIYQIAKEVGAFSTVLEGNIDGIVLTGGIAYQTYLIEELKKRIHFLGKIYVYPGENELLSLAQGALRVLHGVETAKDY